MAEVYRFVKGKKLTKLIAQHEDVQAALSDQANKTGARASANLAAHRSAGDAAIEVEQDENGIDWSVVLTDERGLGAAMSMEYGRPEGTTSSWGPMKPLWILHRAAGLAEGGG